MLEELKALNAGDGVNDDIEEMLNAKNDEIIELKKQVTMANETKLKEIAEAQEESRQDVEEIRKKMEVLESEKDAAEQKLIQSGGTGESGKYK